MEIIKCPSCWCHYENSKLHVCDSFMKMLVTAKKKRDEQDEDEELSLEE